jgi:hypothetical protein
MRTLTSPVGRVTSDSYRIRYGQPGPVDRCIRHGHVLPLSNHREPATETPPAVNQPGLNHGITRRE